MTNQTKQKNSTHNLFAGRTKNEIRHAYFCANLFGTTVEDILKPLVVSESYYEPKERILTDSDFKNSWYLKQNR